TCALPIWGQAARPRTASADAHRQRRLAGRSRAPCDRAPLRDRETAGAGASLGVATSRRCWQTTTCACPRTCPPPTLVVGRCSTSNPKGSPDDVRARTGGYRAFGDAHVGSGVLGGRCPADEGNGRGGCDRAWFVRELHRLLGPNEGGGDGAGRGAGGLETRSSAIDAALRRLVPGRLDAGWPRRLCGVPATRVVCGRGVDGCGRPLRADVVQAFLPPSLSGTG